MKAGMARKGQTTRPAAKETTPSTIRTARSSRKGTSTIGPFQTDLSSQ